MAPNVSNPFTSHNSTDIKLVQNNINCLFNWSCTWGLTFNISVSAHLHFWKSQTNHTYSLNLTDINSPDLAIFSNYLNWDKQYQYMTAKDYSTFEMLRHTFKTNSILAKRKL